MRFRILIVIALSILVNCSTGPDFERDNPYDRDPEVDSLNLKQFPPSNFDKYIFTRDGLKINVYQHTGKETVTVFRKNGSSNFIEIGTYRRSNTNPLTDFFLDEEIKTHKDIGYPLIYRFSETSEQGDLKIDFGQVQNLTLLNNQNSLTVSWQDNVFLNEGFDVYKKYNGHTTLLKEIEVPDSSFSISVNEENLNSDFLISPYKTFQDSKTYLDTTYYTPVPQGPTNLSYNLINSKEIELSWDDNSIFETGFKIMDNTTNEEFNIPANQESFIIQKALSSFDNFSLSVKSIYNEKESAPATVEIIIPDYPYPTILDIEHKDENSFFIYFDDPVPLERKIYFKTHIEDTLFEANQSEGFVEISTSGNEESLDVYFSADLSYGIYGEKYIPISKRPSLKTLYVHDLSINSNLNKVDIRTIGELLIFSKENIIYTINLNTDNFQAYPVVSLPENINLLRMSNDNSTAFATTSDNNSFLINLNSESAISIDNIPDIIYDVSFIENDSKIAISSQSGLVIYSLDTNNYSYLENFDSKAELEFIGDATQTRLLGLNRVDDKIHYFNTLNDFGYHGTTIIDKQAINGYSSEETNVSHLNSDNNVVGFQIGGAVEFNINNPGCYSNSLICQYGIYDPYESDQNAYFQILDPELRLASSENYLRIVDKTSLSNIHVKSRDRSEVSMFKINHDANIAVEFHDDTKELYFYDLSKEWSFTNYGIYFDLVWPSN